MTHHWIVAQHAEEARHRLGEIDLPPLLARVDAHRRLRGPYSAAGSLVRALAGDGVVTLRYAVELQLATRVGQRRCCQRSS